MKVAWSVLHKAGYFTLYIDPKSTDSGRARIKWDSDRLAPKMVAEGIPWTHFIPAMATRGYEHLIHNFRVYASRLKDINEFCIIVLF